MRMWKAASFVLIVACATAAIHSTVRAGLVWDGVGLPDSSVFDVHNELGYLQFDAPEPGIMYYNTLNHAGDLGLGYGYVSMRADVVGHELNYQTGWSWEVRVNVLQNVKNGCGWRDYWGAGVTACDGVRDTCVSLRPDGIYVEGGNPGIPTLGSYEYDSPGYHTIRFEAVPNSRHVNVFVDGDERISVDFTAPAEHASGFTFGDTSSNSDGEAYWDYVAINTVPEPTTFALLFLASITTLAYTWRRRRAS